jgi:stage IV sporulation protein B
VIGLYETQRKNRKKIKSGLAFLLSLFLCAAITLPAAAAEDSGARTLIPVGRAVGVKLFARGVLVVATSDLESEGQTLSPAREGGLKEGDVILEANEEPLDSTEELQSILQENGQSPVRLAVQRGGTELEMTMQPVQGDDAVWRLGAWIRDSMAGIGTVTYYDPATGEFGALGHGITDVDTAVLMPLSSGAIMPATVKAVQKGVRGTPGELRGDFDVNHDFGAVNTNSDSGIFGTLADPSLLPLGDAIPVAEPSEVQTGAATILSNVDGDTVTEYSVEIVKLYPASQNTRNLLLRVTDPRLLETTGGIVQGMSGSPIIQDGRLIGAVTHVFVSDPTQGYGLYVDWMLQESVQ